MAIIQPINDKQTQVLRSNCDFIAVTGSGGSGKSMIVSMLNSFDVLNNKSFSATYLRKNIGDFFVDGGIASLMKEIYPLRSDKDKSNKKISIGEILTSPQNMGVYFDNGATLRFKHIADERQEALEPSFKGIQSNRFIFDEADQFKASTVFYVPTRLRGKGEGKRQIYIVQNPERESFIRQFCGCGKYGGGWIDDNGEVIEEMNGVVRYFHIVDGDINNVFWGKTKKEVYEKCKEIIDVHIESTKEVNSTYENFVQSFVFFHLKTISNKDMLKANPDYLGSLAMSSGSASMFKANWNYSKHDDKTENAKDSMLNYQNISQMFSGKPNINNKLRIVVDPAREGIDNFTMVAFQGFHAFDFWYEQKTDPKDAPDRIREFMNKHGATMKDLIIDGNGFEYIKHLFPGAFFYHGSLKTSNKGKEFRRIRDEAAYVMCQMVDRGLITFEPVLANLTYKHQKSVRKDTTLMLQMVEEAKCYVFSEDEYGKKHIMNKAAQNLVINGKSSDVTDLLVMLCGGLIYDCYRELANKPSTSISRESINAISNNAEHDFTTNQQQRKKSINIANLLTKKFGWL